MIVCYLITVLIIAGLLILRLMVNQANIILCNYRLVFMAFMKVKLFLTLWKDGILTSLMMAMSTLQIHQLVLTLDIGKQSMLQQAKA